MKFKTKLLITAIVAAAVYLPVNALSGKTEIEVEGYNTDLFSGSKVEVQSFRAEASKNA